MQWGVHQQRNPPPDIFNNGAGRVVWSKKASPPRRSL